MVKNYKNEDSLAEAVSLLAIMGCMFFIIGILGTGR
jgi:hypothetical protein